MINTAQIVAKICLTGNIKTASPLLIGSGKEEKAGTKEVDTYVLKDKNEQPFIPGTSLAGVLRHLFNGSPAQELFGYITDKTTDDGVQSAVAIDDILLENATIVSRDGVSIDTYTGTTIQGGKYDYEAVDRGATGTLSMVITIRQHHVDTLPSVYTDIRRIADLLASGAVHVGALTAKGFGKLSFKNVKVITYDFTNPADVAAWLLRKPATNTYTGQDISAIRKNTFVIEGDFALRTSLLVRNGDVSKDDRDAKIHATPLLSGKDYVIPGTSLKGALRHRAAYILRTLGKDETLLHNLMGFSDKQTKQKSRFMTDEIYFKQGVTEAKQTRNAIDRFTGSTMDSKLFAEKALWQKEKGKPVLHIRYQIADCKPWEAGLALFLLKDLWTGRLALGGDVAVGRGYVSGIAGTITYADGEEHTQTWTLDAKGCVTAGAATTLDTFAQALADWKGDEAK